MLSQRNRVVVGFQGWLDRKLPGYSPETARLLTAFATWHHLRRMRAAADADRLVAGAAASVKLQISVAGQLLTHLENQNIGFTQVSQADVDAWLVAGPSTRYLARNFVIWAVKARHLPAVTIPHRTPRTSPILRQDERLSLLRRVLHGEDLPLELRVAATLLLLYAQPVTRICRLRVEDIVITGEATDPVRQRPGPAALPRRGSHPAVRAGTTEHGHGRQRRFPLALPRLPARATAQRQLPHAPTPHHRNPPARRPQRGPAATRSRHTPSGGSPSARLQPASRREPRPPCRDELGCLRLSLTREPSAVIDQLLEVVGHGGLA